MDVIEDIENQTNELRALGINVMDQFSLEQNVAAEVDEAVKKQNRKQKINILNREVKESKLEIMKIKSKENDFEQRLAGMRQRVTDPRKIFAIEKSIKENQKQLKTLTIRKNYIENKLEAAIEDESVLDTVDLNLEEGEVVDEDETEEEKCSRGIFRDKMIKEGKMTPFGTLLIPSVSFKEETEKPLQNAFSFHSFSSSGKNSLTPCTSSTLTLSSENEYHPPR
ncbi:hypothetical protein Anas_07103 [Armadillidium nasatum]|uniref:Uncharacterized protein n=1 Tax=Armadillidium nasatum TaxID=96803 RepID=A0A5N5THU8_9CRUS|nr:hypothetical protein Anas_07103 [Armadillidium nasatum]